MEDYYKITEDDLDFEVEDILKQSPVLVGLAKVAAYANCSTWTVQMMIKAGLRCHGGSLREPDKLIVKAEWLDDFRLNNPEFKVGHE
tara:strand:- start:174 stop:434 length:261 start_codon:yes stop_codon:yes gene_type:complete